MILDPKEVAKIRAKAEAMERLSLKCPVYKKCMELLDGLEALDSKHAIELLIIDLEDDPRAKGTVNVFNRILEFDDGGDL